MICEYKIVIDFETKEVWVDDLALYSGQEFSRISFRNQPLEHVLTQAAQAIQKNLYLLRWAEACE